MTGAPLLLGRAPHNTWYMSTADMHMMQPSTQDTPGSLLTTIPAFSGVVFWYLHSQPLNNFINPCNPRVEIFQPCHIALPC